MYVLSSSSAFIVAANLRPYFDIRKLVAHSEGLPCTFEGILPSPVVDGYRNKCEFAIGLGPDGKQRVVGFQLGSFRSDLPSIHTW